MCSKKVFYIFTLSVTNVTHVDSCSWAQYIRSRQRRLSIKIIFLNIGPKHQRDSWFVAATATWQVMNYGSLS